MNNFLQLLIIPFLIILLSGCGSSDSSKSDNKTPDSSISDTDNSTNADTDTDTDADAEDEPNNTDTDVDSTPNDTQAPNETIGADIVLTVTTDGSAARITGPLWDWDPNGGPEATDNGDGTFSVTMPPPAENMEYLWVVDGVQENLVDNVANGECANDGLNTDNVNYANRIWVLDSGDVSNTFDACTGTVAATVAPELSVEDVITVSGVFGSASIDGDVFTFPSSAESWAGFANVNTALYPITIAEDSVITFTGSVPAGGDADVRFKLERLVHNAEGNGAADTEPSYSTAAVTVSGPGAATYSVDVPSQGANTFSSFIMYLDTRDVGVSVTDIAIAAAPVAPAAGITLDESSAFYDKNHAVWVKVIDLALKADGASSQSAKSLSINVTELPADGANYRVYKTTANGGDFLGNAVALTLGANDISIGGVAFDRAVKIQFSNADVAFDALTVNGEQLYP